MKQNCRDYVRRSYSSDRGPLDFCDLSSSDSLFALLDGQLIRGRESCWQAEVISILAEPDATWVQIGPAQQPAASVLLRMTGQQGQPALEAIEALRAWTDLPEDQRPNLIDVSSSGPS